MLDQISIPSVPQGPLPQPHLAYEQSSQARKWHFTTRQLHDLRKASSDATKLRVLKAWKAEEDAVLPSDTVPPPVALTSAAQVEQELPSLEEQQALIIFYMLKIPGLTRAFKLPELVEASATTYMKRFYLRNTPLDYHPKNIMLTCIYLATKTENYPISLGSFSQRIAGKNTTPAAIEEIRKAIIDLEFPISRALDFEFSVHGVHRSLTGLLLEIAYTSQQRDATAATAAAVDEVLSKEARLHASTSRLTDAELLFAPAQIAYACVRRSGVASDKGKQACREWFDGLQARARDMRRREREERKRWQEGNAVLAEGQEKGSGVGERSHSDSTAKGRSGDKNCNGDGPHPMEKQLGDDVEDVPLRVSFEELEAIATRVDGMITKMEQNKADIKADTVKDIDRRLKLCQDPVNIPGTKLNIKAEAYREAAATQRRKRKAHDSASASISNSAGAAGPHGSKAGTCSLADPFADDFKGDTNAPNRGGGLFGNAIAKKQKLENGESA